MMYDGETWITINLKEGKNATSVASSADKKTIYVGGNGEFGFISFSHSGEPKYISLNKSLPDKEKATGPVWSIQNIGHNTFFCCNDKILWFTDTTFKRSFNPTGEKFHTFFTIENTLMVREAGVGMDYFKNGKLELMPNTSELANVKVRAVIPRSNHVYWLCTDKGLYILSFDIKHPDWSLCTKQNSAVNTWMSESNIYCGLQVNSGLFALGSLNNGVLLVDSNFNAINHINYQMNGLQDNCINFIYKDFSGNLWLALNNGLSYVEINTPITSWSNWLHSIYCKIQ
jgi:hypothetical protein